MLHGLPMSNKLISQNKSIYFIYPGNINVKTGGYIYEKNIISYCRKKKIKIHPIALSSNYPFPSKKELKHCLQIFKNIPPNSTIVIDGLALEGMYDLFREFKEYNVVGLIHHPLSLEFKGKTGKKFFKLEKKYFNLINNFIVTSSETKSLLINDFKIKSRKISVVEPGISRMKKYKYNKKNKLFFLTCGSIIDRKNYLFLMKVFKDFNNYSLNIIGDCSRDSDYYIKIKKYVQDNKLSKNINFIGKVSDSKLSKLYSQTDFYISVSKYEGFGMSLANSLIAKKPIITFYTKTIYQTLNNKGVLYFDRFNVKYLQKLILENCFNKDNFKKLKENVKKNKRYFLTPDESASKFIKILNNA